jgi:hypothetical protein
MCTHCPSHPRAHQSAPLSRFALVAQREQPRPPGLNIGVVYARAASAGTSSAVAWLLNETVRRAASTLAAQPPLARWDGAVSAGPKEVLWDQYILNDAVESAVAGAAVVRRAGGRLQQHGAARDAWEVRVRMRMHCACGVASFPIYCTQLRTDRAIRAWALRSLSVRDSARRSRRR